MKKNELLLRGIWLALPLLLLAGCDNPELQQELERLQQQVSGEEPEPELPPAPPAEPKEVDPEHVSMLELLINTAQGQPAPFATVNPENAKNDAFRGWRFDKWDDFEFSANIDADDDLEYATVELIADCRNTPLAPTFQEVALLQVNERKMTQYRYLLNVEFHEGAWRLVRARWAFRTNANDLHDVAPQSAHRVFCEYLLQQQLQPAVSTAEEAT
ncbi:MAG: hypothetical protein RIC55_17795 [Pirellulaceae bacterium]